MKHARQDYNRIQDPAGLIPEDEPVFLLRGQDKLACLAVDYYAELCECEQAHDVAAMARSHADLMSEWPAKKVPDLPHVSAPCTGSDVLAAQASAIRGATHAHAFIRKYFSELSSLAIHDLLAALTPHEQQLTTLETSPEGPAYIKGPAIGPCKGPNCGSTDGVTHSPECLREYLTAIETAAPEEPE